MLGLGGQVEYWLLVLCAKLCWANNPAWFECRPGTGPCNPAPSWPVTYRMNESMQLMGFANQNPFNRVPVGYPASRWAIFDVDWNTGKAIWGTARPQNCSEMMAKQISDMAASVAEKPTVPKRYMTYRDFVKARPLLTPVREIMNDDAYDKWFVNFSAAVQADFSLSHVPVCEPNTTICGHCSVSVCGPCNESGFLKPKRCSYLYHDQTLMPASGTAAWCVSLSPRQLIQCAHAAPASLTLP